ncbi:MAG: hypothetical protein COC01_09670 [Bacteroidetes bacterium]|nr:MAG: hypothetical protein COC01_09670 [Bacteroidota bacterium]
METTTKEKKGNRLFAIIAAVLFITAAVLGWQFLEQRSIAEMEKTDKEVIQEELNVLLGDYEKLTVDNVELKYQLNIGKEKIKEMLGQIEKLKEKSDLLWKYKKQSKTLRKLLKGYLHEIDSLNKTITHLSEEKLEVESNLDREKRITKELTQEKEQLAGRVELGSQMKTYNLVVTSLRLKSGGTREKEEKRARRVGKIQVCLTIGANAIVESGTRDVYLRIADKDGNVFPKGGDSTKVFIFEEKEIVYSAKKSIDYQNQAKDLCIYFSKKEEFLPQKYTVDIFADGVQIGETWFELE